MKKILITGGAGFVGSHLCKRLLNEGHEVFCLDNLFTGNKKNINELLVNPKFTFILHDITQPFRAQVDQIYNLACPASPIHYQRNPVETAKTSVLGGIHMLDLATKTNAILLQASTSEIYGDPLIHPQTESYRGHVNPIGVRSCYDEGKRMMETLCMDYHRQYGTQIRIVRIFNTFGPHMNIGDGRVVSNFIIQALQNQPLTMYGDGTQTRSFQYVDDLIDLLILLMNNEQGHIGPVNAGTNYEFTMLELANKILQLIPASTSTIQFKDLPMDDPKQRKADTTRAKQRFDRQPKITFEDGLKRTIAYFKNELETI